MNRLAIEGTVGAASSLVATVIWEKWPGKDAFKAKIFSATSPTGEVEKSPLAFVEHYHWGMALAIIGKPIFIGAGAVLVASEFFGTNPFGAGKSEWEIKGNVTLTSILASLLLIKVGSA